MVNYPFLKKNIPFLLAAMLIIGSCKKEKTSDNPYASCPYGKTFIAMTDQTVFKSGMIPATLGATWIYADSAWQDGILVSSGYDTVKVISAEKSGNDIWWQFSDGYRLCMSNDTVYKLNSNGEVPVGSVACPEKTLLFYPVPKDTTCNWYEVTQDVIITGEASVSKETIHTGIGDFDNCLQFKQESYTRIIKPGVGIVKTSINTIEHTSNRTLYQLWLPESKATH